MSDLPGGRIFSEAPATIRAETVVVGSGPGGAISAALLAQAGRDVLIVEDGAYFEEGFCPPFSQQEMMAKYRNGGLTPALGRTKVTYVEGRCVGGGSEINSGLYHRTPPEALERWRKEYEAQALEDATLEPYFATVERDLSVGLLPGPAPAASLKLQEGAQKLGWSSLEAPRWYKYDERGATRQSMSQTYLPRALAHNARLLHSARIMQFREAGGRWSLQGQSRNGRRFEITAEKLILAAGAIQTPALLRRSGIKTQIGNSLRMHPTAKVVARFPEEVNARGLGVPVHQVKEFAPEISFGCSISSPAYLGLALLDHPAEVPRVAENWKRMAIYYAMVASDTTGSVRCLPGFADPLVRYPVSAGELRALAFGMRKLCELLLAAGAEKLFLGVAGIPPICGPGELFRIPAAFAPGSANLMTIHLFSTCPMGENRARCATDSFGRVHGFSSLFINDASLLCTAPGVNPQGSIMALAHRNAAHLVQNW